MAVGATTPQGTTSEISSVGEEIDLMAPGEMVPATGYFDEIIETEGTSMAAPHVAGVASVLWAKDRSKSNDFIKELLKVSAKSMDDAKEGEGLIDLDYALSVYDEFDKSYVENKDVEVEIEENNEAIETFDEAEVSASWSPGSHAYAVGLYDEISADKMEVIKKGARLPDDLEYLKFQPGAVTGKFHAHGNYVASYMYIMRMARVCYNSGMTKALKVEHPVSDAGKSQLYEGIVRLNNDWGTALSGYAINNKNKARILVGIATHIAMDAYAHRAYIKNGSQWEEIIDTDDQDSKTIEPNRWTCAKNVAWDILCVWDEGWEPNAYEFWQSSHNSSKFKLKDLSENVKKSDSETYSVEKSWFDKRSK